MPKLVDYLTTSQFADRSHYKDANAVKHAIYQNVISNAIKVGRQWLIPKTEIRKLKRKQQRKKAKQIKNRTKLTL